jgi:predicted DNA repair protein MutK
MAGASLLALLDDIATLLDDVAALTKLAATKTVGVLGDDLALNAQQVSGAAADRELPVVWAVAKGSARNKAILVPGALALNAALPVALGPLLVVGGTYLCLEGVEKLVHAVGHHPEDEARDAALADALASPEVDLVAFEAEQIRGAVRTDFVLSAEIVTIALGAIAAEPFPTQVMVLAAVAVLMTVGVYGLVATIVKLDDVGLHLLRREGALSRGVGRLLLGTAPRLMRALTVVGTAAMFLVGGGILVHQIPALHHAVEHALHGAPAVVATIGGPVLDALIGVVAGAIALAAWTLGARVVRSVKGRP